MLTLLPLDRAGLDQFRVPPGRRDPAVSECEDAVSHRLDRAVVRDDDGGLCKNPGLLQPEPKHQPADATVERTRRFVAKQYARPFCNRSRYRDALLLAPRELGREMIHHAVQPHE